MIEGHDLNMLSFHPLPMAVSARSILLPQRAAALLVFPTATARAWLIAADLRCVYASLMWNR